LHDLILGRERRGAALGLGAYRGECLEPTTPRIGNRPRDRGGDSGATG
jgi:hypothetical protein